MVEYTLNFDAIFQALSDGTRRDMLLRVGKLEQRISDLAAQYQMSFAAVAKHVNVLAKANLVIKQKQGREQVVIANPAAMRETARLLQQYEQLWTERLGRFEQYITTKEE